MVESTGSSIGAAGPRSVTLLALVVAVPPLLASPLMDALRPELAVRAWLRARGTVRPTDVNVVASHFVLPLEDAVAFVPGMLILWACRRRVNLLTSTSGHAWSDTLKAAAVTILVAASLHVLVDLPSGYIASPEAISRVSTWVKVKDVILNSLVPGIVEEYYYRRIMYGLLRPACGTRLTITITAVAFSACHQLELMPWAFVFGLFSGFVRERSRSVGPTMAIHSIWNGVAYADAWLLI